jgi:tetratricopeptide (TPR) repeat protein
MWPMPASSSKTMKNAVLLRHPIFGARTEAGRAVEQYTASRQPALPAVAATNVTKPTNARIRSARQQAALGVRFAREGRLDLAIQRLTQASELDPTVAATHHDLGLAYISARRFEAAVIALRKSVALNSQLLTAHLNLAVALDFLGLEQEAQIAYEMVVQLDPTYHQAHARLGKMHLTNARGARAEASFRAAAAAAPAASIRARIYEAHAALIAGQSAVAETLLRSVIAEDPTCGEAHVSLGQIQAESGHAAEAAASFERGIMLDADLVAAWYQFATSTKFTTGHQRQIGLMEACLERPDLAPQQRQSIHFALGKAHEDRKNYAEAMRHFDAGNALRCARGRLDCALLDRQTSHVIASTPPGFLDRRPGLGVNDETPILLVGMPRSGTTLVEQILSSHPDVAAGGELGFWRERNRAGLGVFAADAKPEAAHASAEAYRAVLRGISPDAARVTDKMPFNFAHLGVIRQVFPRATIVHCRRHPIATCLSNFATNFQIHYDYAGDRASLVFFYRQYERLMAHWRAVLPADRFLEVDYDDLVADPEPVTRRLLAASGLDWNDACLAPQHNARAINTASLWQARQPIYRTSVERWRHYKPWLGELRTLLDADSEVPLATGRSEVYIISSLD